MCCALRKFEVHRNLSLELRPADHSDSTVCISTAAPRPWRRAPKPGRRSVVSRWKCCPTRRCWPGSSTVPSRCICRACAGYTGWTFLMISPCETPCEILSFCWGAFSALIALVFTMPDNALLPRWRCSAMLVTAGALHRAPAPRAQLSVGGPFLTTRTGAACVLSVAGAFDNRNFIRPAGAALAGAEVLPPAPSAITAAEGLDGTGTAAAAAQIRITLLGALHRRSRVGTPVLKPQAGGGNAAALPGPPIAAPVGDARTAFSSSRNIRRPRVQAARPRSAGSSCCHPHRKPAGRHRAS